MGPQQDGRDVEEFEVESMAHLTNCNYQEAIRARDRHFERSLMARFGFRTREEFEKRLAELGLSLPETVGTPTSSPSGEEALQVAHTIREDRSLSVLEEIFKHVPNSLQGLPEPQLKTLRLAAAMAYLWPDPTAHRRRAIQPRWIRQDAQLGLPFSNLVAARMMLYHAENFEGKIGAKTDFARLGVRFAEILNRSDDSCPACRTLAGKRYRIDDVPDLPFEECTHPAGCECTCHWTHSSSDERVYPDFARERRSEYLIDMLRLALEEMTVGSEIRAGDRKPRYRGFLYNAFWIGISVKHSNVIIMEVVGKKRSDIVDPVGTTYPLNRQDPLRFMFSIRDREFYSLDQSTQLAGLSAFIKVSFSEAYRMLQMLNLSIRTGSRVITYPRMGS